MYVQGQSKRREATGVVTRVIRIAAKAALTWRPRKQWTAFGFGRPRVLRVHELPDHLRRELGLPQMEQAHPTVRQLLELSLF